jgi:hypothetical protein
MKKKILLILTTLLFAAGSTFAAGTDDFIIKVKTDNSGISANTEFTIPVDTANNNYNYNVDCNNDGTFEASNQTGDYTCSYASAGTYEVRIEDASGNGTGFPRIVFGKDSNGPENITTDAQKVLEIVQ